MIAIRRITAALLCLLWTLGFAGAQKNNDIPIIYSARYYTPATSKARSYYHLYRINADATGRKQITSGTANESEPRWSPDGKRILFLRWTNSEYETGTALYIANADGTGQKPLYRLAKDDSFYEPKWEPGSEEIVLRDGSNRRRYVSVRTGAYRTVTTPEIPDPNAPTVTVEKDRVSFVRPNTPPLQLQDAAELLPTVAALPDGTPLLESVGGDSTSGHWLVYYTLNEANGTLTPFTEGKGLYWSPDGKQFVTTRGRELSALNKSDKRQVWVSPLLLGTLRGKTATVRSIVSGMVDVTTCDWRGGTKK